MEEIFKYFDIWGYYIIGFLTFVAISFISLFVWLTVFGFKNAYKIILHIKKFQKDYDSVCNRLMKKLERTKSNIKDFENKLQVLRIDMNGIKQVIDYKKILDSNNFLEENNIPPEKTLEYEDIREFTDEEKESAAEAPENDINFLNPKFDTVKLQNLFSNEELAKFDDTYNSIIK